MPGTYLVKLTVGPEEIVKPLVVEEDPRVNLSPSERRTHFTTVMRLFNMIKAQDEARRTLSSLRAKVSGIKSAESFKQADQKAKDTVVAIEKRLESLNARLTPAQTRRQSMVESAERSPESVPADEQPAPEPQLPRNVIGQRAALLMNSVESITELPSRGIQADINSLSRDLKEFIAEVNSISQKELPALASRFKPSTPAAAQIPPRVDARW